MAFMKITHLTRQLWTNLLLNVLSHAGAVLAESLGVDHAVEVVRGDCEGEGDVLGVTEDADVLHDIILVLLLGRFSVYSVVPCQLAVGPAH